MKRPQSVLFSDVEWSDDDGKGGRDKCSLDLFWLKDESLLDEDNFPDPDVIAEEIADDLRSALKQIKEMRWDALVGAG